MGSLYQSARVFFTDIIILKSHFLFVVYSYLHFMRVLSIQQAGAIRLTPSVLAPSESQEPLSPGIAVTSSASLPASIRLATDPNNSAPLLPLPGGRVGSPAGVRRSLISADRLHPTANGDTYPLESCICVRSTNLPPRYRVKGTDPILLYYIAVTFVACNNNNNTVPRVPHPSAP